MIAFLAAAPAAGALRELRLTTGEGVEPQVDLILTSDAEVQGLVAAFDWDGAVLIGKDLESGAVLAGADLIVRRVEPSYMVLGVVMDTDGAGNEVIPAGVEKLATARFRCAAARAVPVSTDIVFRDGRYGTAELGPILDNLLTIAGQTISRKEGLVLTAGRATCPSAGPGTLRIRDTVADRDTGCAAADIVLDTPSPVQGFSLAVTHDAAVVTLTAITIAGTVTEASGAEFFSPQILPGGGTVGVILDFTPPFGGNTIPIGNGQTICRYRYCCAAIPPAGGPDTVTTLRFADNVLGDPAIENLLVVGGQGLKPAELIPGTFTCRAGVLERPQEFRCGGELDLGGVLKPVVGPAGSTVKLCFYYRSLPKETPGDTGEDQIQGLSMALCYDPRYVQCQEGTFDIAGTITEAVGAEFVNHHCENSSADGDPGELVIGILVDALPPFDGHTLPPTRDLLKVGCIDFKIASDAPCGECNPVRFCDGANGRGNVPTRNLISVNNFSTTPAFFDCEICVSAVPVFQRGDCNWSREGTYAVDIADAAAVMGFIFLSGAEKFHPPCLDSCDANDDSRVDFADAVYILSWLFRYGRPPPTPGPLEAGADPTEDGLDCKIATTCR